MEEEERDTKLKKIRPNNY